MPATFDGLVLSCEHASAAVPRAYAHLFRDAAARAALRTHRGSDLGAHAVARALSKALAAPLFAGRATRLLVDLNRSLHHPQLWSGWSRALDPAARAEALSRHYAPYRASVEAALRVVPARGGRVLHVSVHSFAPRLRGETRTAEIGLLYDPSRSAEVALARRLGARLTALDPAWRVRRNYPYTGVADGFIPWLRRRFEPRRYVGIEIEVNQKLLDDSVGRARVGRALADALAQERTPERSGRAGRRGARTR